MKSGDPAPTPQGDPSASTATSQSTARPTARTATLRAGYLGISEAEAPLAVIQDDRA
jgi:hypothetical protein